MNKKVKQGVCLGLAGVLSFMGIFTVGGEALALHKNETVYTKLNMDGSVRYTKATEQLVGVGEEEVKDYSHLKDIENLNGKEGFSSNGEKIVWQGEGKDIYYTGNSEAKLPISLEIEYFLDGKKQSAKEILGKSGEVMVRLKYHNNSKVQDLYTPFVVIFTTTLKKDSVSDLTVSNGKVLGNGRSLAITAIATPGLYENLGIKELKGSDEIVIKYKTEKVEFGDFYSVATPKIVEKSDLEKIVQLDEVYEKADKLAEGSSKLAQGSSTLATGIGVLEKGISEAEKQLGGTGEALTAEQIVAAGKRVRETAEAEVRSREKEIRERAAKEVKCAESAAIVLEGVRGAIGQISLEEIKEMGEDSEMTGFIIELLDELDEDKIKEKLTKIIEALQQSGKLDQAVSGICGVMQQAVGEVAYRSAVTTAGETAEKMGTTMLGALDKMLGGVRQLSEGAKTLEKGMTQFDQEGIKPLVQLVNGDLKSAAGKIQKMGELSEKYQSFGGKNSGDTGTTKFVIMVEKEKKNE